MRSGKYFTVCFVTPVIWKAACFQGSYLGWDNWQASHTCSHNPLSVYFALILPPHTTKSSNRGTLYLLVWVFHALSNCFECVTVVSYMLLRVFVLTVFAAAVQCIGGHGGPTASLCGKSVSSEHLLEIVRSPPDFFVLPSTRCVRVFYCAPCVSRVSPVCCLLTCVCVSCVLWPPFFSNIPWQSPVASSCPPGSILTPYVPLSPLQYCAPPLGTAQVARC
jgi:hypothetical protein